MGWGQEKSFPEPGIIPYLENVQFFTDNPENVVVWPEGQTLKSKNPIVEINHEFKVPGEESTINIPSTQKGIGARSTMREGLGASTGTTASDDCYSGKTGGWDYP